MADTLGSIFGLPDKLPTSFAPAHGWTLSWLLPLVCCAVIAACVWAARDGVAPALRGRMRRLVQTVLAVCALLSVCVYADFGVFRYGTYFNEWDVYHYYLGSKYAPELGYTDLYSATLIADAQAGLKYSDGSGKIRSLETYQLVDANAVLADRERHVAAFAPERWSEFVRDVSFFKSHLTARKWSSVFHDHGYNGTPAWSAVVGMLFTRQLSITEDFSRFILMALDPLLLLAGLWAVARAFSLRTALLLAVFIGTHYLFSWGHLKGAILRTDFAILSLMSICAVKLGRYRTAGVLLGGATLSRVFPGLLLVGLVVHGLDILIRQRRVDRDLLALAVSFVATLAVGILAGALYGGETNLWAQWTDKIGTHIGNLSDWKMGYAAIIGASWELGFPELVDWGVRLAEEPDALLTHELTSGFIRLAILVPALYFARGLRRWEAMAYSFVFFFFILQAAYYYYLFLIVPLLFFLPEVQRPGRAIGAASMFLTGAAGYLLFAGWTPLRETIILYGWRQLYPTYYFLSWLTCLTCLYMVGVAAIRTHALDSEPPEPEPADTPA